MKRLDISSINGFGYSYLDWEYAKRKQDEPELSFDDVLKESMEKLDSEDNIRKKVGKEYDSERFDKFDHFINSRHEASQKYRQWVKKNAAYKPAALTYGKKKEEEK